MKWYPLPISMFLLILPANSGLAELAGSTGAEKFPVVAVTLGEQRSNVRSTDRSFQTVRSIKDLYGCITTNLDDFITPSNRALTRYEFATGLNNYLTRMNELSARLNRNALTELPANYAIRSCRPDELVRYLESDAFWWC